MRPSGCASARYTCSPTTSSRRVKRSLASASARVGLVARRDVGDDARAISVVPSAPAARARAVPERARDAVEAERRYVTSASSPASSRAVELLVASARSSGWMRDSQKSPVAHAVAAAAPPRTRRARRPGREVHVAAVGRDLAGVRDAPRRDRGWPRDRRRRPRREGRCLPAVEAKRSRGFTGGYRHPTWPLEDARGCLVHRLTRARALASATVMHAAELHLPAQIVIEGGCSSGLGAWPRGSGCAARCW